ncbi:MAG: choice-of-anchor J domain-containing protein, partial [Bacteroidia bacterium]
YSGNPTTATWTTLSPTLSSGSWNWTNSGTVSLASFKSANTRIAFKYSGTSSAGSTWEVDNISVFAD